MLEKLELMDGRYLTNAADVLFCKSKGIRLKQGVLATHSRTEILGLQQESGTVFDLVRKAQLYILNNTRRRFVIKGVGPRDEVPEIPQEAVKEAVFNAYCHMDWTRWDCVLIDIFYDTVEILSPGWFIPGQDPVEHLAGRSKSSKTRNPLIAQTLYRSKDIEHYATGLPRIKELCDAAGIRVEYRHVPDGTLLVFHRRDPFEGIVGEGDSNRGVVSDRLVRETINPVPETLNETLNPVPETIKPNRVTINPVPETLNETLEPDRETINETLNPGRETIKPDYETITSGDDPWDSVTKDAMSFSPEELAVLGAVALRPNATYVDIAETVGISRAQVGRIVQTLKAEKVLEREGSRKRGAWRVVPGSGYD